MRICWHIIQNNKSECVRAINSKTWVSALPRVPVCRKAFWEGATWNRLKQMVPYYSNKYPIEDIFWEKSREYYLHAWMVTIIIWDFIINGIMKYCIENIVMCASLITTSALTKSTMENLQETFVRGISNHWWIPLIKGLYKGCPCFRLRLPKYMGYNVELPMIWDTIMLIWSQWCT